LGKIKQLKRLTLPEDLTTEKTFYAIKKVLPGLKKIN